MDFKQWVNSNNKINLKSVKNTKYVPSVKGKNTYFSHRFVHKWISQSVPIGLFANIARILKIWKWLLSSILEPAGGSPGIFPTIHDPHVLKWIQLIKLAFYLPSLRNFVETDILKKLIR